jgi:AcrR family transcriptional regulator
MQERSSIAFNFTELSQRAELNHGLVRYHFGAKDNLLLAVLTTVAAESMKDLARLVSLSISPVRKMELHIRGVVRAFGAYPFMNPLVHYLVTRADPEFARQVMDSVTRPLVKAQSKMLAEGAAAGVFREVSPMFFYCQLMGTCEFLFTSPEILRHGFAVDRIDTALTSAYADHIVEVMLRGICLEPISPEVAVGPLPRHGGQGPLGHREAAASIRK